MKSFKYFVFILSTLFLFAGCQKEYSLETGNSRSPAKGSLRDVAGNCQPFTRYGAYIVDSTLTDSNYVLVQVNITTPGSYKIFSDVQNGFSFKDSGYIGSIGLQTIKLKGTGRPILAITTDFTVSFDSTFCLFSVVVSPRTGTGPAAVYTLATSTGGTCAAATPQGTYTTGTPLVATNLIQLNVNVTSVGSWSVVTTQTNGMRFAGTGTFATTGAQTIQLRGTGTPVTAGATTIPVTAGVTSCSFTVNVTQGSGTGGGVNARDSAWSFTVGNRFFHGPFDVLAEDTTIAGSGHLLLLVGSSFATGDSVLTLGVFFPGGAIQTGTYNTNLLAGIYFEDYRDPNNPADIYYADNSATGVNTVITVTAWNPTTRVVTGTFAGTAKNAAGSNVTIVTGKFNARVD